MIDPCAPGVDPMPWRLALIVTLSGEDLVAALDAADRWSS